MSDSFSSDFDTDLDVSVHSTAQPLINEDVETISPESFLETKPTEYPSPLPPPPPEPELQYLNVGSIFSSAPAEIPKMRPLYAPKKDETPKLQEEIDRLEALVAQQRTVIDSQKGTIRLLMNEAVSHEEIAKLRAAVASKSPLLQAVAATPLSETRALTQLRAENAALVRQLEEAEDRHLAELRALRAQYAAVVSRDPPTDGCAVCKRRIRELEEQLKQPGQNSEENN